MCIRDRTFSTHIHISVDDPERAIKITNATRRWIPALLALSCNSPFFEGENTGFKSSRSMQFGAFPRTNIPVKIEGTAPGVINSGGVLSLNKRKLRVKALPKNLPDFISVDISNLHLNDNVTIQDLLNDNYSFIHPENMVVCQVKMSRASLSLTTGEEEDEDGEEVEEGVEGSEGGKNPENKDAGDKPTDSENKEG